MNAPVIGQVVPLLSVTPNHFMAALHRLLEDLTPAQRERLGLAMDCCVGYGALQGIAGANGGIALPRDAFMSLYAEKVQRLMGSAE